MALELPRWTWNYDGLTGEGELANVCVLTSLRWRENPWSLEFLAFLCWVDGFDQHSKQPNHLELWDGPSAPSCRVFVHGLRGWAGLVWPEYLRFVKGQEEHIPWQSPWLCLQQSRRLSRDLWEIQSLREGENVQEKRIVAWAYNQLWNIWDIKGKVTLGYSLFYWAFLEARYIIW